MEQKKPQGPSKITVALSAVVLCVVLIGASYFFRDESQRARHQPSPPAASMLQGFLKRCDEGPVYDSVDGRMRTRCTAKSHPAFMLVLVGDGEALDSAKMLVPVQGNSTRDAELQQLGLDLFSAVAGVSAESFLPVEFLDAVGVSRTSFVFEGRTYTTLPAADVGLVFEIGPVADDSAPQN